MTEQFSFNLIDEKWIPCIRGQDNHVVTLSLRETFAQSHTLHDIVADTPLQTAALYRLLIAILLRVYKPTAADLDQWQAMWQSQTWDMEKMNAYLDEQMPRFDLFAGKRPFYQSDCDDSRVRPKPITSIKYGNGFLHNPLFDHDNEENGQSLTSAQAARNLITVQTFGLGGGNKGMFSDAPWAKGIIFFVQGNTLKETLLLNLLPYPDEERQANIKDSANDAPAWEQADPFASKEGHPDGYLDYLTWQNRRILLCPERQGEQIIVKQWQVGGGMTLAAEMADPDPSKFYTRHKKHGLRVQQFAESRGLWPDSYALFAPMTYKGEWHSVPPVAFLHLKGLINERLLQPHLVYRCKALGQGKDRAKIEFLREERYPFPLRYLVDEPLREQLRDALQKCESAAFYLQGALRRVGFYLYIAKPDEVGWKSEKINLKAPKLISELARKDINEWVRHTEADIYFWSSLDVPFQQFIEDLAKEEDEAVMNNWQTEIRTATKNAFDKAKAYAHESDRAYRAIVEGHGYLNFQLNKLLSKEVKA